MPLKQAEKGHDFGSGSHLTQHHKAAHEEPRYGPCSRCGNKFKSLSGFHGHLEKQLDCVQLDAAVVKSLLAIHAGDPLGMPATAPRTAEDEDLGECSY